MKNRLKRLGFKNQSYLEQLSKIPYNFVVSHDYDKKVTDITIYGVIGDAWFDESTSASDIDNALKAANGNDIVLRINSPGGDAFDGVAIYNRLMDYKKEHEAKITSHVDGWACSAASFIPLAADERIMGLGTMMMIHEAHIIAWGTKQDLKKAVELLEKLEDGIVDIYETKIVDKKRDEIQKMMNDETWFTAQEAVDVGFADKVAQGEDKEPDENNEKEGAGNKATEISGLVERLESMQKEIDNLKNQKEPKKSEPKEPAKNSRAFLF